MFRDTYYENPDQILVKDFLTKDIRTANVFEKFGIDFCCNGNRPIKTACLDKNIDVENILSELEKLELSKTSNTERFENWELNFLSEYIVNNHHSYVRSSVPQILPHLEKVVSKHGKHFPQLIEIKSLFEEVAEELYGHMQKEEKILFHIIKYLSDCKKFNEKPKINGFGTIKNPIESMEAEHTNAGGAMEKIRELTNNFTPPEGACNTFKLTFRELEDFEKDLHIHVHLENNILFPKAIALEEELLK